MAEPIGGATPPPPPAVTPKPTAGFVPPAPPPPASGDQVNALAKKGIPAVSRAVEADVQLVTAPDGTHINGSIQVAGDRLAQEMAARIAMNPDLRDTSVRFDAANGTFIVSGKWQVTGPDLPLSMTLTLGAEDGQLALQFKEIDGLGPNGPYQEPVIKAMARGFRMQGLPNDDDANAKSLRFRTPEFLGRTGLLPGGFSLSPEQQVTGVSTTGGKITLQLTAPQKGTPAAATPASDVSLKLDAAALEGFLKDKLSPNYELGKLTLAEGQAKLQGRILGPERRDAAVDGIWLGLAGLAAMGGRWNEIPKMPNAHRDSKPLDVWVTLRGDQLVFTPSDPEAVSALGGQKGDKSVTVPLLSLWDGKPGQVAHAKLDAGGLSFEAHLD